LSPQAVLGRSRLRWVTVWIKGYAIFNGAPSVAVLVCYARKWWVGVVQVRDAIGVQWTRFGSHDRLTTYDEGPYFPARLHRPADSVDVSIRTFGFPTSKRQLGGFDILTVDVVEYFCVAVIVASQGVVVREFLASSIGAPKFRPGRIVWAGSTTDLTG